MTAHSLALRPTALRGVIVVLAAAVLAIVGALPALAHAALVRSSPESGATLTAAPPEVALTFNEEINPQFATVTVTAGGSSATTGDVEVDGTTVYQSLDPEMAAGTYTVAYRVTSADGHPVSGSFDFTYAPGGDEGSDESGGTSAPSPTTSGGTSTGTTGAGSPSTGSTSTGSSAPTTDPTSGTSEGTGTGTGTSATSGASAPESTTTSSSTSSTSADGASSPSSSTPTGDGTTTGVDDQGIPWWVWLLVALGGGAVIGTIVALGRRGGEDVDLEGYEPHPQDGDDTLR